jgi:hypothetical protein
MENNRRLSALNQAYYFGELDLSEYRQLRSRLIDEQTQNDSDQTQRINTIQHNHTLKMDSTTQAPLEEKKRPSVSVKSINIPGEDFKSQNGPSVLQFLWVSVAVILFIYMYTATID